MRKIILFGVESCQIVVVPKFFGVIRFSKTFDVHELREIRIGGVGNYFANFFDCAFKFRANNILVKTVGVIITAGEINGGNAKFRCDERDVGEGALRDLETLAGDILLEVKISALVENSIIGTASVNFND